MIHIKEVIENAKKNKPYDKPLRIQVVKKKVVSPDRVEVVFADHSAFVKCIAYLSEENHKVSNGIILRNFWMGRSTLILNKKTQTSQCIFPTR